jgi:predicted RNA-binding Zn-ribbon protein involved in translation (DUF1610 family)
MKIPSKMHLMKERRCPHCGERADAATSIGHEIPPSPGDRTLCLPCGEWMIFDAEAMRKPTDDELIEIGLDKTARLMREAWVMTAKARVKAARLSRAKSGG